MEWSLAVIGLNHRTAPVEVRERYWIGESRRYEALHRLAQAGGISEAIILATCNRTEFILATTNFSQAANSVLEFLTAEYGLRASDWTNFYRLEGRQLNEIPERPLQEQMTAAVRRLFQLQPLEQPPPCRGRSEIGSV